MSVFPIIELTQKFFNSDPFEFDTYFSITPDYQKKYCLGANAFTRFTVGVVGKELALLTNDIALHLLAGAFKLAIGGLKSVSTIVAVVFSQELDYQTPIKQGVVHLGFVCLYALDFFASIANIGNRYPQYLVDKTRNVFADFLKTPDKETNVQYIIDPEIERALKIEQEKTKEQEAILRRTQEELHETRHSDFITEEELEKIFKEAEDTADKKVNNDYFKRKNQKINIKPTNIFGNKVAPNPSNYMLTYDIWDKDSHDIASSALTKKDCEPSWFEDEEAILRKIHAIEENKSLKIDLNPSPISAKDLESPKTNAPITKSSYKKNSIPTSSALHRRLNYEEQRKLAT